MASVRVSIFLLLTVLASATTASSATLEVQSDKTLYSIGETVTLTIVGDAEGASSLQFFVPVSFDETRVTWLDTEQTTATHSGGVPYIVGGATDPCNFGLTPGWCPALDQIAGLTPVTPDGPILATMAFRATAAGTALFDILPQAPIGQTGLIFFGLESVPDTSVFITGTSITVIPEPGTGALLGLGLLGLAGRRSRS